MQSTATVMSMLNLPSKADRRHGVCAGSGRITRGRRLFSLGLDDLLPAVVDVGADVMAQVHFARGRLRCERRGRERVVGPMHAALRRGFPVLRNCHGLLLLTFNSGCAGAPRASRTPTGPYPR